MGGVFPFTAERRKWKGVGWGVGVRCEEFSFCGKKSASAFGEIDIFIYSDPERIAVEMMIKMMMDGRHWSRVASGILTAKSTHDLCTFSPTGRDCTAREV